MYFEITSDTKELELKWKRVDSRRDLLSTGILGSNEDH